MVHQSISTCIGHTPMVALNRLFSGTQVEVLAKLELLNPYGSIKDRPANFIIEHGLREGIIHANTHLIESSSGNFGIALAMTSRLHNLSFTSVVDPKISPTNLRILELLGAHIEMVDTPDDQGGYLKTRIKRVKEMIADNPNLYWINQYANQLNWQAHYHGIGTEIIEDLDGSIDCLVTAVSTTGTIMGTARRLRRQFPRLHVIAVDAVGSLIFGGPSSSRHIPGIGSSRVPELLCSEEIDQVVYVDDLETVEGCRRLMLQESIFAGGSSGSVIAAITKLLPMLPRPYRIVTILPDRGERYLETVYNDEWIAQLGITTDSWQLGVVYAERAV